MKQTSRKKVLVSSVAMMMVATVSLGSATFAWFSNKTSATAQGLQASTTQASNLLLSKTGNENDWHSTIDYDMGSTVLEPVTTKDFTSWKYATADGFDAAIANSEGLKTIESTQLNGYVAVKDLYIKSSTETMNVNWAMTLTETDNADADFFRVAVQKVTDDAPGSFVYGNNKDDFSNAPESYTDKASTTYNSIVTTDTKSGSLGELTAGKEYHYRVYLYYEGTDKNCIDTNAVNTCNVSFTFSKNATA